MYRSHRHAIATIFTFGAIGAASTAFIATLGPQTGLRTMIITRYSSGYVGGTIYSFFNILTQVCAKHPYIVLLVVLKRACKSWGSVVSA